MMETARGGGLALQKGKTQISQRNEKGDGRAKEHYQGENKPKPRQNGQNDGLTLHPSGPGMSSALKVPSTLARAIWRIEGSIGSP